MKQLTTNLDFFNLLVPVKSAYRRHHFPEKAFLMVVNGLQTAVDAGDFALLFFLDQSSTFDTIDHFILLNRLSVRYGVTRVELFWISSYICRTVIHLSASEVSHLLLNLFYIAFLKDFTWPHSLHPVYFTGLRHFAYKSC